MAENNTIATVQNNLIKKENNDRNLSVNWNEWLKIKLYNEYFLEYNIFSKSRKNITSSRQHNTQEKEEKEENIIKIMTESWI